MTVGVYGLVAGIVKLDDAGLHLSRRRGDGTFAAMQRGLGAAVLRAAPWLMKGLSSPEPRPCSRRRRHPGARHPVLHHLGESAGMLASLALNGAAGIVAAPLRLPASPWRNMQCDEARAASASQAMIQAMGPLSGLKILEFEAIGPGPFCGMLLADMGADVIVVDRPASSGLGLERERWMT